MMMDLGHLVEEKKSNAQDDSADVMCEVRVLPNGNRVHDYEVDLIVYQFTNDPSASDCINVKYAGSLAQLVNATAQSIDRVE